MPPEPMKSLTAEWLNNMVHLYRLCLSVRLGLFSFFLVVKNSLFQYSSNSSQTSGGSKRDTRDTRPLRSNFFHFHKVFGKKNRLALLSRRSWIRHCNAVNMFSYARFFLVVFVSGFLPVSL